MRPPRSANPRWFKSRADDKIKLTIIFFDRLIWSVMDIVLPAGRPCLHLARAAGVSSFRQPAATPTGYFIILRGVYKYHLTTTRDTAFMALWKDYDAL